MAWTRNPKTQPVMWGMPLDSWDVCAIRVDYETAYFIFIDGEPYNKQLGTFARSRISAKRKVLGAFLTIGNDFPLLWSPEEIAAIRACAEEDRFRDILETVGLAGN
jgi:hypothetical protein